MRISGGSNYPGYAVYKSRNLMEMNSTVGVKISRNVCLDINIFSLCMVHCRRKRTERKKPRKEGEEGYDPYDFDSAEESADDEGKSLFCKRLLTVKLTKATIFLFVALHYIFRNFKVRRSEK